MLAGSSAPPPPPPPKGWVLQIPVFLPVEELNSNHDLPLAVTLMGSQHGVDKCSCNNDFGIKYCFGLAV